MTQDRDNCSPVLSETASHRCRLSGMEYFEIDSGFIVRNLEKKRFVVGYVNPLHGGRFSSSTLLADRAAPDKTRKKTFPQYHGKHRVMLHCLLQRFLQQIRLDVLFQLENRKTLVSFFPVAPEMPVPRCPAFSSAKNVLSSFSMPPYAFPCVNCFFTAAMFSSSSSAFFCCFSFLKKCIHILKNFPAHIGVQCQAQNSRAMRPFDPMMFNQIASPFQLFSHNPRPHRAADRTAPSVPACPAVPADFLPVPVQSTDFCGLLRSADTELHNLPF